MPVRGIVFDLDGTLIDSRADIVEATNHMLREHGRPARPDAEILGHVGDGARALIAGVTALDVDDPDVDDLLATFVAHYTAHATDRTTLMPGAGQALDELRHLPLAVCTNKPRVTTDAALAGLGLATRFDVVVAGDDLAERKPSPAPVLHVAERLGIPPATLVMVGDGPQDVEAGRAAGARTVGVEGGILPRERLIAARPDRLIETLADLGGVVREWERRAGR